MKWGIDSPRPDQKYRFVHVYVQLRLVVWRRQLFAYIIDDLLLKAPRPDFTDVGGKNIIKRHRKPLFDLIFAVSAIERIAVEYLIMQFAKFLRQ